ncbi:triacylglycerol lipase [Teladorsagia circumcincta]|uniref:Triacylglycerol lipase n=1 Tax=Teladorsagia circumcincta TaxID=45464 RepID=A0A2G9UXM4_TELCI|nr:triacylglycerol lipase [Teladorsagia circumcincta]
MLLILTSSGLLTTTLALVTQGNYSDEFARTKMLPLAAAAYSGQPQECLANRFNNATVTGHSLGAALATLAASYVVAACHVPSSKVFVITFGQPRVGDYRFARAYEEKVIFNAQTDYLQPLPVFALYTPTAFQLSPANEPQKFHKEMGYSFRVTHWRDWVPHVLPEKFFNYYHHSPEARSIFSGDLVTDKQREASTNFGIVFICSCKQIQKLAARL